MSLNRSGVEKGRKLSGSEMIWILYAWQCKLAVERSSRGGLVVERLLHKKLKVESLAFEAFGKLKVHSLVHGGPLKA